MDNEVYENLSLTEIFKKYFNTSDIKIRVEDTGRAFRYTIYQPNSASLRKLTNSEIFVLFCKWTEYGDYPPYRIDFTVFFHDEDPIKNKLIKFIKEKKEMPVDTELDHLFDAYLKPKIEMRYDTCYKSSYSTFLWTSKAPIENTIKHIYANLNNNTIAVKWTNNTVTTVKLDTNDKDEWDLEAGVNAAIVKHQYKNHNSFKKFIQENTTYIQPKKKKKSK